MYTIAIVFLVLYLLIFKRNKPISIGESSLVLLLIALLLLGSNGLKDCLKTLRDHGGSLSIAGNSITLSTPNVPNAMPDVSKESPIGAKYHGYDKTQMLINESIARQQATKNIINNGDFKIPLGDNLSKWGCGLYSDGIKRADPNANFTWINFLNADIDISVEETALGNALKIVHKSEKMDHKIGVIEQRLQVVPSKYRLSFWAKELDDFQGSALWFVTTDNWVINEKGITRGYDLKEKGPFGWRYFSEEIQIDRDGYTTFSIVSIGKGIVYITDVSLIKQ